MKNHQLDELGIWQKKKSLQLMRAMGCEGIVTIDSSSERVTKDGEVVGLIFFVKNTFLFFS